MAPATPLHAVPTAPRERARTARREALLETAEQVFAERGFAGATMAEIAARGGYSAGNLYNVFESKRALYQELLQARGTRLLEEQLAILRSPAPYSETFDHVIDHLLHFCVQHRAFWVLYVRGVNGQDWSGGPFEGESARLRDELEDESVRRLARGMADGELPEDDPVALATVMLGAFHHHIVRWIQRNGSTEALWESAKGLRRVLRRGLGATR